MGHPPVPHEDVVGQVLGEVVGQVAGYHAGLAGRYPQGLAVPAHLEVVGPGAVPLGVDRVVVQEYVADDPELLVRTHAISFMILALTVVAESVAL